MGIFIGDAIASTWMLLAIWFQVSFYITFSAQASGSRVKVRPHWYTGPIVNLWFLPWIWIVARFDGILPSP